MQDVVYFLWVFDIADCQIADIRLNDNRAKAEKFPTHSWYIIAYVVDFGQFELHYVATEEAVLRHLAEALVCQDEDSEIPHDELIREKDEAHYKAAQWQ